jgi:DNA mismatch repair protein MutS
MEEEAAAENLTPMMRQYRDIQKQLSGGTLLFFRLGDFYEMFYDDAEEGARILGLALTHRGGIPMAGVPYHAAASYIDKLLQTGKKVAICDQLEGPQPGKKLIERSLTRVISPGTVIEDAQLAPKANHYIVCIEIQLPWVCAAWLDLSTGEFRLCYDQNIDDLLSVVTALYPKEWFLQDTLERMLAGMPALKDKFQSLMTEPVLSTMPAHAFDHAVGYQQLREVLNVHTLDGFGIDTSCPALGAAGALMQYVTQSLCQKPKNIRHVSVYMCKNALLLNASTVQNLEIFKTLSGTRENSLLGVIDQTVTAGGGRKVEQFLTHPLIDIHTIQCRQNVVKAFVKQPSRAKMIQQDLTRVRDILRLLSRLQNRGQNPRDLGAVRETLLVVPEIKKKLAGFEETEVRAIDDRIEPCQEVCGLLQRALKDELPNDLSDGGYVKEGYDSSLDHLKNLMASNRTWLTELERSEQEKTGIRNLKIRYNPSFGYSIEVTKSQLALVPLRYIRKQTMTNSERYYTEELKSKEQEILQAESRALDREKEIFVQLVKTLLVVADVLREMAVALSEIDVFVGWSCLARENTYVCPEVNEGDSIVIQQGRHPVVEQTLRTLHCCTGFVPNDACLSATKDQILLITGPNMAGKSTYIRQVALIVLMAQIGCWVPAKHCKIGLVDRMFSRIGASDNLSRGQSTFMVEMTETANILNNATSRSLVILDEIGRGTSTYDGLSIAWSVVEYLHGKNVDGPRTLFATHYHELTQLETILDRVVNYSVTVKEWHDEIIFVHKIVSGAANRSYGIQVAKLAGLPAEVIERSKVILEELETEGKALRQALKSSTKALLRRRNSPQLRLFS